ncbi:hypothetical protein AB0H43_13110 [Hamadaea sp. NPDC050747]|uniref:hypothetical protein n=1 Tax=Hamadaea sp. NPDC050747 TaxID=3155789 RepID=UPI0033EA795C
MLVVAQWTALILVALAAFATAAALLHRRETRIELLDLGRQARRAAVISPPANQEG